MPRKEKVEMKLECILTDDEKLAYAKSLSDALNTVRNTEAALKSFTVQAKAEIQVNEEQISLYAQKLSSGKEYRDVTCRIIYSHETCQKTTFRSDTGEVVKIEAMSGEELQEELPLPPPAPVETIYPTEETKPPQGETKPPEVETNLAPGETVVEPPLTVTEGATSAGTTEGETEQINMVIPDVPPTIGS